MPDYRKIPINKDDLKQIIYFVLMKFKGDPAHLQGTSTKRDLIGGYIERWFNKIAEPFIFDELLKDKNYKVVPDYFIYKGDSEKNAPDILGLQMESEKTAVFAQYNNGTWVAKPDMPKIEVKVFRKDQALLGVRETQMDNSYFVFVESDLSDDYLTAIFEGAVFDEKYFRELEMSEDFIQSDSDNQIVPHSKIGKADSIGTIRLIGTYTKEELRNNTTLCARGISPYYFFEAVNVENIRGMSSEEDYLEVGEDGLIKYTISDDTVYLPFSSKGLEGSRLKVLKRNKGSVYVEIDEELEICGFNLKMGLAKIAFKKFDRTSGWDENIALKYIVENYAHDCTDEMVSKFDEIASSIK